MKPKLRRPGVVRFTEHLICGLFLSLISQPVLSKEISSASQLGPYQFHTSITSGDVVGANLSEQGGFDTAAELVDPIIAGVQVPGILSTDAKMTPNGPATWVQVQLRTGEPQFINFATIEVISEVSYELAVLGTVAEAEVIVDARGKRNSLGNLTGSLLRARSSALADIKIYETDALGNRAAIFHSWRPENINAPTPGISNENFSDVDVLFDDRNDRITVATNQVYEVLVTSSSFIEFRDISSFNLDSFAYIESSFSTPTPDVQLAVSAFDSSDVTQEFPPPKTTATSDGASTNALIRAGARLVGSSDYLGDFQAGDAVEIIATIEPESADIGEDAELFLIVSTEDGLFQANSAGFEGFDGNAENLSPLSTFSLRAVSEINLTDAIGGQISFRESDAGTYELFVGYATEQSSVKFTEQPIVLNVQ